MTKRARTMTGRPFCCYCKRALTEPGDTSGTAMTFDHVRPISQGGWRRVPCCRACNHLKADLEPQEWFWFIGAFARWWRTFDTPDQVADKVREERVRRVWANAQRGAPA